MREPCSLITPFTTKSLDDNTRTFTGLAATWDLDRQGDIIRRGAFNRTIKSWNASGRPVPMVDNHGGGEPGTPPSIRDVVGGFELRGETERGLEVTGKVLDTPDGEEVYARLKAGLVTKLSIGASIRKREFETIKGRRIRILQELELGEISLTVMPAQPGALIESVKSMLDGGDWTPEEIKEAQAQLSALLEKGDPAPATPADLDALADDLASRHAVLRKITLGRLGIRATRQDS